MGKSAEAGCLQVPNADTEWRFKRNPLVLAERPIKFFASASKPTALTRFAELRTDHDYEQTSTYRKSNTRRSPRRNDYR